MLYCKSLIVRIQRYSPKSSPRLSLAGLWNKLSIPGSTAGKESACNAGDPGSIPELGRSPGGGHGNPLQYSCLENPHGQRSLAGCRPWGHKDMTEGLSAHEIRSMLDKAFIWLMQKCRLRSSRFFRQFVASPLNKATLHPSHVTFSEFHNFCSRKERARVQR